MNIEKFGCPTKPGDIKKEIEEGVIEFLEIKSFYLTEKELIAALFLNNKPIQDFVLKDNFSASDFVYN